MWAKTTTRFVIVVLVFVLFGSIVSALPTANPRKGRALFKKNCRVCHDGKTEEAPLLQPAELIMDQWERAFKEDDDVAECVPRVKDKTGAALTEQDLLDIKQYLVDGAADSEQPMTCG